MKQETFASVFDSDSNQIAKIALNGYNIQAGGPLGDSGAMRSFRIVEGDLTNEWSFQLDLRLSTEEGQEAEIRVAAMPAEKDGSGFIEFL